MTAMRELERAFCSRILWITEAQAQELIDAEDGNACAVSCAALEAIGGQVAGLLSLQAIRAYAKPAGYQNMLKAIRTDPASHSLLTSTVSLCERCDPVDALKDLQVALVLAEMRLEHYLEEVTDARKA